MLPQGSVFISYRRSDSIDVTGRIYDQLVSHYGQGIVFKDVDSIPYGVDFREHIHHWINRCQVMIVVIGPTWLETKNDNDKSRLEDVQDWVRVEIEAAIEHKILIVPLLVSNARPPRAAELPNSLQGISYLNCAQARPDPDFHNDLKRLIKNLDRTFSYSETSLSGELAFHDVNLKIQRSNNSRLSVVKINGLEKRLSVLCDDYEALSNQLNYVNNAVEKNSLKRQRLSLEKEISELEAELASLIK